VYIALYGVISGFKSEFTLDGPTYRVGRVVDKIWKKNGRVV